MSEAVGRSALDTILEMNLRSHSDSLNWNPIRVLDHMNQQDDVMYWPLTFATPVIHATATRCTLSTPPIFAAFKGLKSAGLVARGRRAGHTEIVLPVASASRLRGFPDRGGGFNLCYDTRQND